MSNGNAAKSFETIKKEMDLFDCMPRVIREHIAQADTTHSNIVFAVADAMLNKGYDAAGVVAAMRQHLKYEMGTLNANPRARSNRSHAISMAKHQRAQRRYYSMAKG